MIQIENFFINPKDVKYIGEITEVTKGEVYGRIWIETRQVHNGWKFKFMLGETVFTADDKNRSTLEKNRNALIKACMGEQ
jgi:hypothetical protein